MQTIQIKLNFIIKEQEKEVWVGQSENGITPLYGRKFSGNWSTLYPDWEDSGSIEKSTELIICNKDWEELGRSNHIQSQFPSLEKTSKEEWEKIKESYPTLSEAEFYNWLYEKMPENISYDNQINWNLGCRVIESEEPIHSFEWLDETFNIVRVNYKHTCCDAKWHQYFAAETTTNYYLGNYIAWLGVQIEED